MECISTGIVTWDIDKLADLMNECRHETMNRRQIGSGRGWVAKMNGVYAGHEVEIVCSYASAMGIHIHPVGGHDGVLRVTDRNHYMTPTTVQHIHRYMRDCESSVVCYKLYKTRSHRVERNFPSDRPMWMEEEGRKLAMYDGTDYLEFLRVYTSIFDTLNASLPSYARIPDDMIDMPDF